MSAVHISSQNCDYSVIKYLTRQIKVLGKVLENSFISNKRILNQYLNNVKPWQAVWINGLEKKDFSCSVIISRYYQEGKFN